MTGLEDIKTFLRGYDGPMLRLMEVCGTHTAQISRLGISGLLSENIRLISGPGCPVCVTVTGYVDKLIDLGLQPGNVIVTFGDMLRVTGSKGNLSGVRALGADVRMVYSPLDTLKIAESEPGKTFVFAAVGFETTAPVYAVLLQEAISRKIRNIRLLTSLKTMPQALDWVAENQSGINGFIAPGHVSVITGSRIFEPLAKKYGLPFAVTGFEGEEILAGIYALVKAKGRGEVYNLYPAAVTREGNSEAQKLVDRFFKPCDAAWRGMGIIPGSGMTLREEYLEFDAGSAGLDTDHVLNPNCRCAKVLTGAIRPDECPLFGKACTPTSQQGACMVSSEGSCYHYYINNRRG